MTAETPRSAAPELPTAPASPQVDPEPTPTTNGPETANLGDRAGVTLAEAGRETLDRVAYAVNGETNPALFAAVESLIAARVDAALAPVRELAEEAEADAQLTTLNAAVLVTELHAALDRQEGH